MAQRSLRAGGPMLKFKVSGLQEAIAGLDELPKATQKNVRQRVAVEMLEPIEKGMEQFAPELTGGLVRSIGISKKAIGGKRKATRKKEAGTGKWRTEAAGYVVAHVGPGPTPNSLFQEFGTVNMTANPFARPAFDSFAGASIAKATELFKLHIGKATARMEKKRAKAAAKGS